MAKSAVLNVQVLVDAAKAATGLNETAQKFESFGKKLAGGVLAAVAIGGITELAKTVVTAASDMQQAVGGTDKVFGSSAGAIHSWAADTEDSIRLPAKAVEQFATLIKTQLNATGLPIDQLVNKTKALVQVGADLSAVTGADLADSIAAVKSALAGEFDPIQNLGVAMSGASVQARALALAHGDATLAASDAIVMQARVAEIMDKSAFATGAAAEEADSFQGRMDSLTEKVQNLAVTIGGPMLDSLSDILGTMTEAAGGATNLATGLGLVLGAVLGLPGPIQAVVFGLGALVAVSAAWGAKVFGFVGSLVTATTSVAGFKAALASIGPALAGGAILTGVVIAIGALVSEFARVRALSDDAKAGLQGVVDALVASTGVWNAAARAAEDHAIRTSTAFKELRDSGFTVAQAIDILKGSRNDLDAIDMEGQQGLNGMSQAAVDASRAFIEQRGNVDQLAQAQIDANIATDRGRDVQREAAAAHAANAAAMKAAVDPAKKLADAIKAAQDAASKTVVNRALDDVKSQAEEASRAVGFLHKAIDGLTGGTKDYEEAQVDFNKTISAIPDAFKAATEAGDLNKDALVAWNVQALTQNKTGQDIYDTLTTVQGGYENLVGAAYASANATGDNAAALQEAQNNAHYAYESFVSMASAMGLSDEQVKTLARNLGIFDAQQLDPKIFKLIAEDEEARKKVEELQRAGVDPLTIHIIPDDAATPAVESAIQYYDDKTHSTITIPFHADPPPAEETAAAAAQAAADAKAAMAAQPPIPLPVVPGAPPPGAFGAIIEAEKSRLGLGGAGGGVQVPLVVTGAAAAQGAVDAIKPKGPVPVSVTTAGVSEAQAAVNGIKASVPVIVMVSANTNSANTIVSGFMREARTAVPIVMPVNLDPANAAVNAFLSVQRQTTVLVYANTSPANIVISALVREQTTKTIAVNGDNSGAITSIRNITTGSYTATIHVVADTSSFYATFNALPKTSLVPPPRPGGLLAPTLSTTGAAPRQTSTNSASTNITVQVGVGDPDAIARQIRQILRGQDRRSGGISI